MLKWLIAGGVLYWLVTREESQGQGQGSHSYSYPAAATMEKWDVTARADRVLNPSSGARQINAPGIAAL